MADPADAQRLVTLAGFGEALRWLRIERGLSLSDLAHQLAIDPAQISRYETGAALPRLHVVDKILQVLETDLLRLGVALRLTQGVRGSPLVLPEGLTERERGALLLTASAFREFIEAVAHRADSASGAVLADDSPPSPAG